MSKRFKLLAGVLGVCIALAIALTSVAFAQGAEEADSGKRAGFGPAWPTGEGPAMFGRGGLGFGEGLSENLAELLGLSSEEILQQRQEGLSLAEIAASQGIDESTLIEALVAPLKERLQERVAEGTTTQEQADQMLERATEQATQAINRSGFGPPEDGNCPGFGEAGATGEHPAMSGRGGHGPGECFPKMHNRGSEA